MSLIAATKKDVQEVGFRVDKLEGRFDHLEGRFDHLEGRFDKLESRVDQIETKFTKKFEQVDENFRHMGVVMEEIRGDVKTLIEFASIAAEQKIVVKDHEERISDLEVDTRSIKTLLKALKI